MVDIKYIYIYKIAFYCLHTDGLQVLLFNISDSIYRVFVFN